MSFLRIASVFVLTLILTSPVMAAETSDSLLKKSQACHVDSDCAAIESGACHMPAAINTNKLADWQRLRAVEAMNDVKSMHVHSHCMSAFKPDDGVAKCILKNCIWVQR